MEYGYFSNRRPVSITCFSDGDLHFEASPGRFGPKDELLVDSATIRKSTIAKLDKLVKEIMDMTSLEMEGFICDGPSFECTVTFENGIIRGFGYVAEILPRKYEQLEENIRKILRENYFLKKHRRQLGMII